MDGPTVQAGEPTTALFRAMLLMHADPAFAAGSGSFSSGLETLVSDGWVTDEESLEKAIESALSMRWDSFDRNFLARVFNFLQEGDGDTGRIINETVCLLDADLERRLIGFAARRASRRAGGALLGVWSRLGDSQITEYRQRLTKGAHLPIAQGIVGFSRGLALQDVEALAGWALVSSYVSSAVRIGVIGHRSMQHLLIRASSRLDELLSVPVDLAAEPVSWTPIHDIALERHARSDVKLFAS